ncbi:hypothetical protein BGZ63DRAFT_391188 [Mariannaea sp. PMI_226]|nr:hypothetical protein BGZ63DRAFT_391188 [Mariannaea sp. PMI_226]
MPHSLADQVRKDHQTGHGLQPGKKTNIYVYMYGLLCFLISGGLHKFSLLYSTPFVLTRFVPVFLLLVSIQHIAPP